MAEEKQSTAPVAVPDEAAPKSLFTKLAEVMGEIGWVKKRGRNQFHNYDYVTEGDLVDAIREKLADRSVVIIPGVDRVEEREAKTRNGTTSITTVFGTFTFVDGQSGEQFTAKWAGRGDDPMDKGLYKAYTGALKYFLMKTFLVATGDDPEADSRPAGGSTAQVQQRVAAQAPQAPAQPPLDDAKAKTLTAACKAAYDRLKVADPSKVNQAKFDEWLAASSHSHERLGALASHLTQMLEEASR